jgi:quercetin dioxygenase-like cupin family protein
MNLPLALANLGRPDHVTVFPYGRFELYRVGGREIGRAVYEPGWRWSEHVAPIAGTSLCQVSHFGLVLEGEAAVAMSDGTKNVLAAGDLFTVPPGHDSWVLGTSGTSPFT